MKTISFAAAVTLAITLSPVQASAVPMEYQFLGTDATNANAYSFAIATSAIPTSYTPAGSFTYDAETSNSNSLGNIVEPHTFYNSLMSGGFDNFLGAQLYTGSEAAPAFVPGSYAFQQNLLTGASGGTLTISEIPIPPPPSFHFVGTDTTKSNNFSFDITGSDLPSSYQPGEFVTYDVLTSNSGALGDLVATHSFYNSLMKGGFDNFFGAQLYTGTEDMPQFTPGTYVFHADASLGTDAGTLLISQNTLATAVPEPANWVLIIAGFGISGAMMRRRCAHDGTRPRLAA